MRDFLQKLVKRATTVSLFPLLKLYEWYLAMQIDVDDAKNPVFIIGAPRTGSTVLYQALSNNCDVAYIDNTACTWHRNLLFGMWLSRRKYGNAPHNNFVSERGDTHRYGGHAPSECGGFWYRWLPREKHFVDHHEVSAKMVVEIREQVMRVSAYLNKPLLFKNLNAGQRLRLISRVFPRAKFIFIRRDPRFVIRSILKARRDIGVASQEWWSIMPQNVADLLVLGEAERCAAQVYFLEKQIEEDLSLFPAESVKQVHYQQLCGDIVRELSDWIGVPARKAGKLPEFSCDSLQTLGIDELRELDLLVGEYPFSKELFI